MSNKSCQQPRIPDSSNSLLPCTFNVGQVFYPNLKNLGEVRKVHNINKTSVTKLAFLFLLKVHFTTISRTHFQDPAKDGRLDATFLSCSTWEGRRQGEERTRTQASRESPRCTVW